MTPFDGNKMVTCWIPLRSISDSEQDSGLIFAEGSHKDFALPFWHHLDQACLESRGYSVVGPIDLQGGDASWHHGWIIHSAGPQPRDSLPRGALAISFIADGTRILQKESSSVKREMLKNDKYGEDRESYADWIGEIRPGGLARHKLLPIVWPRV